MADLAALGRWDDEQAYKLDQEALAIFEETCGLEDSRTLDAMDVVANWEIELGRLDAAIALLRRALSACDNWSEENPLRRGQILTSLMRAYALAGKAKEAIDVGMQALDIAASNLGTEHEDYGILSGDVANLHIETGQPEAALVLTDKLLPIHDRVHGVVGTSTQKLAYARARALELVGRTDDAQQLVSRYGLTALRSNLT